jgi:single-strand DNA-binding protein
MNNLRNKVQLIGNLGLAPEIVSFENGNKLAKVRLATNDFYKNAQGEKVQETQWHSLTAWGKQADVFEKYIKKGQEIAVEGKLVTRSYETKEGEKRFRTEVVVSEVLMLGNKEQEVVEK